MNTHVRITATITVNDKGVNHEITSSLLSLTSEQAFGLVRQISMVTHTFMSVSYTTDLNGCFKCKIDLKGTAANSLKKYETV